MCVFACMCVCVGVGVCVWLCMVHDKDSSTTRRERHTQTVRERERERVQRGGGGGGDLQTRLLTTLSVSSSFFQATDVMKTWTTLVHNICQTSQYILTNLPSC